MKGILFIAGLIGHTAFSGQLNCTHYWIDSKGNAVPSGAEIGSDVGESPFASQFDYKRGLGAEGEYLCEMDISSQQVEAGTYLYLGEIGDASYLEVVSAPSSFGPQPVFTHGLSPQGVLNTQPIYLRIVPFFVSLRHLYRGDGRYLMRIKYKDLVAPQAGMRSGDPSVETLSGLVKRFLGDSPSLTYFVLEFFLFFFAGIYFLSLKTNLSPRKRMTSFLGLLAAAFIAISVTSVLRVFGDPVNAIKINDIGTIIALPILHYALSPYLISTFGNFWKIFLWTSICIAAPSSIFFMAGDPSSAAYLKVYSLVLAVEIGLTPVLICGLFYAGLLRSNTGLRGQGYLGIVLAFMSIIGLHDTANALFLEYANPFWGHYAYLVCVAVLIVALPEHNSLSERSWNLGIDAVIRESQRAVTNGSDIKSTMNWIAAEVANLTSSERVCLIEYIREDKFRFMGTYGSYHSVPGEQVIGSGSKILEAVKQDQPILDRGKWVGMEGPRLVKAGIRKLIPIDSSIIKRDTSFAIMPLVSDIGAKGVLCMTNFREGPGMPPFVHDHLADLIQNCSIAFHLLVAEKRIRAQSRVIIANRVRTYWLKNQSEQYFLENFDLSESIRMPAFIIGDMVDSSVLNKQYDGKTLSRVIDAILANVYEEFKDEGIVIDKDKGDFVSIMVLNRTSDKDSSIAILRAQKILEYLSDAGAVFDEIARAHGVAIPVRFNWVMSQCESNAVQMRDADNPVIDSFNLFNHAEIDKASRVLDKVSAGGECLILENAAKYLDRRSYVALAPVRLKGIGDGGSIFLRPPSRQRLL